MRGLSSFVILPPMPADTPTPATTRTPVSLFYSYAHEDEALRDELQDHLMILERRKAIRSWHDRAIVAGQDWNAVIDEHLRTAELVLLLVSKDFIASDYIMGAELQLAMERHARGEAVVVPIMLRQVDLQPEDAEDLPFVGLLSVQGLPKDLKPVTSWTNRDEAWTNVASGLRAAVKAINARRPRADAAPIDARAAVAPPPPAAVPPQIPVSATAPAVRPAPADSAVPHHDRLTAVCEGFAGRMGEAAAAKGGAAPDASEVRDQAMRLIDLPDATRVLWVDDHPEGNAAEIAALARLQIEVVTVRSTADALTRLSADAAAAPFDLVISDWHRKDDGPLAGLSLLSAMRDRHHGQPLVFFHGAFGTVERTALAVSARAAGAHGEAVMPDELMRLVLSALHA